MTGDAMGPAPIAHARPRTAVSLPEILVAAGLGVLVLSMLILAQHRSNRQAASGDAQTRAWNTYLRLSSYLRHDLLQAVRVELPEPRRLEIEAIEIDQDFRERPRRIVYLAGPGREGTITRTEGDQVVTFAFADALGRGEQLLASFSRVIDP